MRPTAALVRLVLLSASIAGPFAVTPSSAQFGRAWPHAPSIAVVSVDADPRLELVDEAIAFWNRTLEEIGAGLRLPPVSRVVQPIPEQALQTLSASTGSFRRASIPDALRGHPADLTIFLAQSEFVSFAGPFDADAKRVIGIRGLAFPPMALPNVARNVITHEIGHALGLGHNSDPTKLMCGRPAPCRPAAFQSPQPRIFPLTEDEKRELLRMYPGRPTKP